MVAIPTNNPKLFQNSVCLLCNYTYVDLIRNFAQPIVDALFFYLLRNSFRESETIYSIS